MDNKDAKLLLIGLDGAMPDLVKRFSQEKDLPYLHQLIQEGVFLEVLPSPPCDTPTNWVTIATGAWTGTHGVTGFNIHLPGESYEEGVSCAFDTKLCQAEFLWNVAEREGLTCLLYDYPPSRPPTIKNGIVLGGWFNPQRVGRGVGSFHSPGFIPTLPYPRSLLNRNFSDVLKTPIPLPKGTSESLEEILKKAQLECERFINALGFLKKDRNWEVLFSQLHLLDYLTHEMLNDIWEGHPDYTADKGERGWSTMKEAYSILDETIGRVIEKFASEETIICVISDHGGVPSSRLVWPGAALQRAGLTKFIKNDNNEYQIDVSQSKAVFYFSPPEYIWVNLEGRDPTGIVKPGKEYEEIRTRIINALLDIRDPENGKCPFSLVIRKEQADFIGQWDKRCGDIVIFTEPEYTLVDFGMAERGVVNGVKELLEMGDLRIGGNTRQGSHHGHLPTHRISPFSISGVAIIVGPNVRRGYSRQHPVQMVDIAPTLAHLLGWPKPAQAEGGILWDIFK